MEIKIEVDGTSVTISGSRAGEVAGTVLELLGGKSHTQTPDPTDFSIDGDQVVRGNDGEYATLGWRLTNSTAFWQFEEEYHGSWVERSWASPEGLALLSLHSALVAGRSVEGPTDKLRAWVKANA